MAAVTSVVVCFCFWCFSGNGGAAASEVLRDVDVLTMVLRGAAEVLLRCY